MSQMPDGNSAALRQHEAEQDRNDSRHAAYGERIMQDVLDELFAGRKVKGYTLHDFTADLTEDDLVSILRDQPPDDLRSAVLQAKIKLANSICAFFEEHEADYLADRERDWQESDRAEAQER